jgi:alkylation response protein AidB-like acyl-CoA dehydrogenase
VTSSSRILSRRDLDFMLYEWLDVERLTRTPRYAEHSREVFDSVLDLFEEIAEEHFAPINRLLDENEPTFDGVEVSQPAEAKAALEVFARSGLASSGMDAEIGGGQLPHVVQRAGFAWLQAANCSLAAYPMLSMANASALAAHGTPEQVERFVVPQAEGRFTGTMCLSEPQAGSSLADIVTRAVPATDGTYRLFGNKMWISAGEHSMSENIVHLVLAREAGGPAGVKGLSLFIVPKFLVEEDGSLGARNDVVLAGLNHKMGYRGTVNTFLNFGEGVHPVDGEPGAVGYRVGTSFHGLAYMFHMMNEARIGVGAGAVALGYTGYLHALDYARTRAQGRLVSDKDPESPQVTIDRHPDVKRMLVSSKAVVEGGMGLILYSSLLLDESTTASTEDERAEALLLLDVLTPIAKAWPSTWCLRADDWALQIHGGYGYTREYPVEQFYRDNRLNPIHEGTDGIQAVDLIGRKLRMDNGAGLTLLESRIRAAVDSAPASLADEAAEIRHWMERAFSATRALWAGSDPELALANATRHADALGHVVVAWMWLEQLIACDGRDEPFYEGKRLAGRYFIGHMLPEIGPTLDLIEARDRLLLDIDPNLL